MKKLKINYNETFGTKRSRDYYRGTSFHFAGKWFPGVHYLSDDYVTDFVTYNNTLLACTKSHLSLAENKPTNFILNDKGEVIGIVSRYWTFVCSGLKGPVVGVRFNDETKEIEYCEDVYAEEPVWTSVVRIPQILQQTGNSEIDTISQKVITEELNKKADTSYVEDNYLPLDGSSAMEGNLDMNGHSVIDVEWPTGGTDAANKDYVDEQVGIVSGDLDSLETEFDDYVLETGKLIPSAASESNKLADKAWVSANHYSKSDTYNKSEVDQKIQTETATFRGTYDTWDDVPTNVYDFPGNTVDNNDYIVVRDSTGYGVTYVGTWRFKYSGSGAYSKTNWLPEYQINEEPLTPSQEAAINSGITDTKVAKLDALPTNSELQSTYMPKSGGTFTDDVTMDTTKALVTDYIRANVNGAVDFNGDIVTNIGDPIEDGDAATKRYVDNGLSLKADDYHMASFSPGYKICIRVSSRTLLTGKNRILVHAPTKGTLIIIDYTISYDRRTEEYSVGISASYLGDKIQDLSDTINVTFDNSYAYICLYNTDAISPIPIVGETFFVSGVGNFILDVESLSTAPGSIIGSCTLKPLSDVFIATYGVDSFSDVYAAYQAGKMVLCNYNDTIYVMTDIDDDGGTSAPHGVNFSAAFSSIIATVNVDATNGWSYDEVRIQEELVSGTNIKTINSTSLLGSGDIQISADTSDCVKFGETISALNHYLKIDGEGEPFSLMLVVKMDDWASEYLVNGTMQSVQIVKMNGEQSFDGMLRIDEDTYYPIALYHEDSLTVTPILLSGTMPTITDVASASGEEESIPLLESTSNKVTSISSSSTDEQYPSAKAVYDALVANDKVFVAEYGSTTYSAITAALSSGKAVFAKLSNGEIAPLSSAINSKYYFGRVFSGILYTSYVGTNDSWNNSNVQLTTSWGSTPSDSKYPTEKLVKDSIDALPVIPSGGTAGQVLTKASGTDYDVEWANGGDTSDCVKYTQQSKTDNEKTTARTNIGITLHDDVIDVTPDPPIAVSYGKMGVISQTQTWSGSGSNRTYVMSNLVTGLIPQANIDMFVRAGATFNDQTGYFEMNGLTDLSYNEMMDAMRFGDMPYTLDSWCYYIDKIRTNFPTFRNFIYTISTAFRQSEIEAIAFHPTGTRLVSNGASYAFYSARNLKRIIGILDITNSTSGARFIQYASLLESFQIKGLKFSIEFSTPYMDKASLLYLVNNEASTSAITITLEASVYAKCQSGGEWYSDISTALAAHTNVSLASA